MTARKSHNKCNNLMSAPHHHVVVLECVIQCPKSHSNSQCVKMISFSLSDWSNIHPGLRMRVVFCLLVLLHVLWVSMYLLNTVWTVTCVVTVGKGSRRLILVFQFGAALNFRSPWPHHNSVYCYNLEHIFGASCRAQRTIFGHTLSTLPQTRTM